MQDFERADHSPGHARQGQGKPRQGHGEKRRGKQRPAEEHHVRASIAAGIRRVGVKIHLRRVTGTHGTKIEARPWAVTRGYNPEELVGGVEQGDRLVLLEAETLAVRHWPAPPVPGDEIVIAGRTASVEAVDTHRMGETDIRYLMQVRG